MPPNKENRGKKRSKDDEEDVDEEYKIKRKKNNQAVKKSRDKTRQRTMETQGRVNDLKKQNSVLEEKIKLLRTQLTSLKELFVAYASSGNVQAQQTNNIDIEGLLGDDEERSSQILQQLALGIKNKP